MAIESFSGKYSFLSNFYVCMHPGLALLDAVSVPILFYPTVEHAYQAAKTIDPEWRHIVQSSPTPGEAKRVGRKVPLRPLWDDMRLDIMSSLLWQKFMYPQLRRALLNTGDQELIEGNTWGDRFWGKVNGEGRNELGCLLMGIRWEISQGPR